MKDYKLELIYRIIDANINRAKEGLRVSEEIARFVLNSRSLTAGLKKVRHEIDQALKIIPAGAKLYGLRNSLTDVGFGIKLKKEFRRCGYKDIFFANIARVKESVRVLEEFSKLKSIKTAALFKKIRYEVYDLEKKFAHKFLALRYHK